MPPKRKTLPKNHINKGIEFLPVLNYTTDEIINICKIYNFRYRYIILEGTPAKAFLYVENAPRFKQAFKIES